MSKAAKNVYVLGMAAIVLILVVALAVQRGDDKRALIDGQEEQNFQMVQTLANVLWSRFSEYITSESIPDGSHETEPQIHQELHAVLEKLTSGLPVVRMKIYNIGGDVVLSHPHPSRLAPALPGDGFRKALDKGGPVSFLIPANAKGQEDGEVFPWPVVETYAPVAGPDGELLGVFEIYTDVSPQMKRLDERTLRRGAILGGMLLAFYLLVALLVRRVEAGSSPAVETPERSDDGEQRLRALLDGAPFGFAVLDPDGAVLADNPPMRAMLGGEGPIRDLLEDATAFDRMLARIKDGQAAYPVEARIQGEEPARWIELSLETAEYEAAPAVAVWARDITAEKKEQREREEGEQNLLDVIEASPVAVGIADETGRFLYWNPLFFRLGQQLPNESGNIDFRLAFVDPAQRERLYADLDRDERVENRLCEIALDDGTTAWTLISMRRMMFEGQMSALTWVYDITRMKEQQDALDEAREAAEGESRRKSEYLATMSHEIRTAMIGVSSMAELLDRTPLTPEQRHMNAVARESTTALVATLEEIMDFARIEAGAMELEPVDASLSRVVEDAVERMAGLAAEKGLELFCHVDPGLPDRVQCDAKRMRQILANLIGNAVKFTDAGQVFVDIRPAVPGAEAADGETVEVLVEVVDTGPGIPPDALETLFKPYARDGEQTIERFGGAGLGLSICRALASLMGGGIEAANNEGGGAAFRLRLPLLAAAERRGEQGQDMAGSRVLLATGGSGAADVAASYLAFMGAATDAASSAETALDMMRRQVALGAPYKAAVVDSALADVHGRALVRAIHADSQLRDVRLVLLRPFGGEPSEDGAEFAFAVLDKPIRRGEFRRAIAAAAGLGELDRPAGRRADDSGGPWTYEPPSVEEARAAGALVLVAEDNDTNRSVIRIMLDRLGYACELAMDGAEAWRMIGAGEYGLVLTDCHMPEMDGYELTRKLRTAEAESLGRARLPVIALTADALPGTAGKSREAGMDGYLKKPVGMEELEAALREHLPRAESLRGGPPVPEPPETSAPEMESIPDDGLDDEEREVLAELQGAGEPEAPPPPSMSEEPAREFEAPPVVKLFTAPPPEKGPPRHLDDPEIAALPVLETAYLAEELGVTEGMIGPFLEDFLAAVRPLIDAVSLALAEGDRDEARAKAQAAAAASKGAGAERLAAACEKTARRIDAGEADGVEGPMRDALDEAAGEIDKASP